MEKVVSDPQSRFRRLSLAVRHFFPDVDMYTRHWKIELNIHHPTTIESGSAKEELYLPALLDRVNNRYLPFSDIDTMIPLSLSDISPFTVTVENHLQQNKTPGFCFLKLPKTLAEMNFILSPPLNSTHFLANMTLHEGQLYIRNHILKEKGSYAYKSISGHLEVPPHAGKSNDESPAFSSIAGHQPMDYVPCVIIDWPEDAVAWQTRERKYGWPTPDAVETAVTGGCHLVSKSHPLSEFPDIQWRYSFSKAEVCLAKTLQPMQQICYKVFKALIVYHERTRELGISSYLLKTTFFWVCEQTAPSDWNIKNLGKCFLHLLDTFLGYLRKHELSQYFIPENNLILHLSKTEIQSWIKAVKHIREYPLLCMRDFYLQYAWYYSNGFVCPSGEFYVFLAEAESATPCTPVPGISLETLGLLLLGFYHAYARYHGMLLTVIESLHLYDNQILKQSFQKNYCSLRELILLKCLYEFYIDHILSQTPLTLVLLLAFPAHLKSTVVPCFKAEIACLCYQMSGTCNGSGTELHQEAEELFKEAVGTEDCGKEVLVKYAQYLVVEERYDEAFPYLQRIIGVTASYASGVSYSRYTSNSVEETLRIGHCLQESEIHYHTPALAYYLLIVCCKELRRNPKEYSVPPMNKFFHRCKTLTKSVLWDELTFLEGCFMLRYGNLLQALYLIVQNTNHWLDMQYMLYLTAKMFIEYHEKYQTN